MSRLRPDALAKVSLNVRDGRRMKWSFPLVSISESEETDCGESSEPDEAECTDNHADSAAGRVKVKALKLKKAFCAVRSLFCLAIFA